MRMPSSMPGSETKKGYKHQNLIYIYDAETVHISEGVQVYDTWQKDGIFRLLSHIVPPEYFDMPDF